MGEGTHTCAVAVLVPHPTSSAFLCASGVAHGPERGPSLPVIDIVCETPDEPTAVQLVRALSTAFGQDVVLLRTAGVAWEDNFDVTQLVAEIESLDVIAPAGHDWVEVDPAQLDRVEPGWAGPKFQPWMGERANGWAPRRPAWSRPGWFGEASAWMSEQMSTAGLREPEPPQFHQLWGISVVLSARSRDGRVFFKCSGPRFRHEPTLTRALAAASPDLFPRVIAVEPERGWMLMRDFGGRLLGDEPSTAWGAGLDALASVQRSWLGRTDELVAAGAEDRPLADLAAWVAGLAGADVSSRLPDDVRGEWSAAAPDLVDACRRLDELSPGPTLVHGDLHPWNVAATDAGPLLFDWTDAAVSHPFVDLATYVTRTPHVDVRHHLRDRYLAHWADSLPPADLAEAGRLALVVGSLYQARTYSELGPTLLPEDLGELAGGEVDWLLRALRRHRSGLHTGY